MGLSIQDYLKKINSGLTYTDIMSLFITCVVISLFLGYIWHVQAQERGEVVYVKSSTVQSDDRASSSNEGKPFGSKNGTTYTYSWCSGSGNIKPANKIYFASSEDAEAKGKRLSKLCEK